jgi:hypothetical protein
MKMPNFLGKNPLILAVCLLLAVLLLANFINFGGASIHYATQVKPILNKKCISCHGGVKQSGEFSMMTREHLLRPNESGKPAVVPGEPDESELMKRIQSHDPEERMPYEEAPLSKKEISILRQWIKEGAQWGEHWAYVPVQPVKVPKAKGFLGIFPAPKNQWVQNDIDWFILDRLKKEGLSASPMADKATLLRRVSLDLIGQPAPGSLAKKYLADKSPKAYENLVDSLLALPAYGERWASMWLDLARYADTKGYERDYKRDIWRYRDWLIRTLNKDMPYNEFLTEQLAGDLLPNPTDDQYLATAFHRNTPTNDEGGTLNEEYRVVALIDRVNTTFEAILGTTFACTQCHGHPYEAIFHDEYYKVMAYFNNSRDEDTNEDYPLLRHYPKADSLKLDSLCRWVAQNDSPKRSMEIYTFLKTLQPSFYSIASDQFVNCELYDTKWLTMRNHASARFQEVDLTGKSQLILPLCGVVGGGRFSIHLDSLNGPLLLSFTAEKTANYCDTKAFDFQPVKGKHRLYFRYENPSLASDPRKAGISFNWFHFSTPFPGQGKPGYEQKMTDYWALIRQDPPTTPIMMDNPATLPRPNHVFERGNWLVKGQKVSPGVPALLGKVPVGAPSNRLGFAQWVTDPKNPLTARTMVNRMWEQVFGQGLAETLEDLGSQGIPPTHPELMDYLAWQFVHEQGWSMKKLLREMVLSATYRQSSVGSPDLVEIDPANKFYARGPRVRLSAEQIRDQALSLAGLLSHKKYGPGVMPYQPDGIWKTPYNSDTWVLSEGEDRYRRAVYTYCKRSSGYPSMLTFDGATRAVCSARRIRTNTPLQALVTLNDPVYIEAAKAFAQKMKKLGGSEVKNQIKKGYSLALGKHIEEQKLQTLVGLYDKAKAKYAADPQLVQALFAEPGPKNAAEKKPASPPMLTYSAEDAALTLVANALLNLDELVSKN